MQARPQLPQMWLPAASAMPCLLSSHPHQPLALSRTSSTSTASSAMPGGLPRCCFCISAAARLMPAEVTASARPATAARRSCVTLAAATGAPAVLLDAAAGEPSLLSSAGVAAAAELLVLLGLLAVAASASAGAACEPGEEAEAGVTEQLRACW